MTWIKCSEKLPGEDWVLICCRDFICAGFYCLDEKEWYIGNYSLGDFGILQSWIKVSGVTHWMPLPEEPKE